MEALGFIGFGLGVNLLLFGFGNENIAAKKGLDVKQSFWLGLLGPIGMCIVLAQTNPSAKDFGYGVLRFIILAIALQIFVEGSDMASIMGIGIWIGFPFILRGKYIIDFGTKIEQDSSVTKTSDPVAAPEDTPSKNISDQTITSDEKAQSKPSFLDNLAENPYRSKEELPDNKIVESKSEELKKESTETKDTPSENPSDQKVVSDEETNSKPSFLDSVKENWVDQLGTKQAKEELRDKKIVESKSEESVEKAENKLDNSTSDSKQKIDIISKEDARKELIELKKLLDMDLLTKKEFNEKAVELKKIILDK